MKRFIAFAVAVCVASAALAETISVAAAVSMKDALTKVAGAYKAETGDEVEFSFGSSGQLAQQIQSGAPVDLFISAANKQVDDLIKANAVLPETRGVVAGNALVAIVPADASIKPASTKELENPGIAKIAIGEPKSVPAGQYAEQALKGANVFEKLKEKLVLGTNVRQVLDYVERGEVNVGLVYATDAKISGEKVRVAFIVGESEHSPIVYPAVVVTASKKPEAAKKFMAYLLAEKAQAELRSFGFTPPPSGEAPKAGK